MAGVRLRIHDLIVRAKDPRAENIRRRMAGATNTGNVSTLQQKGPTSQAKKNEIGMKENKKEKADYSIQPRVLMKDRGVEMKNRN